MYMTYYRNSNRYNNGMNQKTLSDDTINHHIERINAYLSNKTSYLVTVNDVKDNSQSLDRLAQKENAFKEIHVNCITLINMLNESSNVEHDAQNNTLAHLVSSFDITPASFQAVKEQLVSLAGEIEQNLYMIAQATFIEHHQKILEEIRNNYDATNFAQVSGTLSFWDVSANYGDREKKLQKNDNAIKNFVIEAENIARTPTGIMKAIAGDILGTELDSSNYQPYLLRRAAHIRLPQRLHPMQCVHHDTLPTIKHTLVEYFKAITAARIQNKQHVSLQSNRYTFTFNTISHFLRREYQPVLEMLGDTDLYKSDGFAPYLHDAVDNGLAILTFEKKQAKIMRIYIYLQVLIEALDDAARTGNDTVHTLFDDVFCDLMECNVETLRHALFLMLRKISYTLYHIEQAIFFERIQAAVVTKNAVVQNAQDNHAIIYFLNLADTDDVDIHIANAITVYNHQAIQNYLDYFTKNMQQEHRTMTLGSFFGKRNNQSVADENNDVFFQAALDELRSTAHFSCTYNITHQNNPKEYKEAFTTFVQLINAYPKPAPFTLLQEPSYTMPKPPLVIPQEDEVPLLSTVLQHIMFPPPPASAPYSEETWMHEVNNCINEARTAENITDARVIRGIKIMKALMTLLETPDDTSIPDYITIHTVLLNIQTICTLHAVQKTEKVASNAAEAESLFSNALQPQKDCLLQLRARYHSKTLDTETSKGFLVLVQLLNYFSQLPTQYDSIHHAQQMSSNKVLGTAFGFMKMAFNPEEKHDPRMQSKNQFFEFLNELHQNFKHVEHNSLSSIASLKP